MAQTNSCSTAEFTFSLARIGWLTLILATLYVCYFHNLGALGLVGPDEPRYASIARDMAETGDWITPRLYGKPWFEKPVFYYWATALSFKLLGVNEVTARLPNALAALLATLAMAWLTCRVYATETARWLLLLLPTTVGMIGFSHAAATDMLFTAMLTVAMVFAVRLLGLDPSASFIAFTSSASFTSFLFGFFLGLAVLAKGPAALVLSSGAVLLWAAFTKRWRDASRCLHPLSILGFCSSALPWYILCARRNPDFFRIFIVEHNFKRYLTPEFQHIQPFWFYAPIILLALFPWTLLLVPAVNRLSRDIRQRQRGFQLQVFLISWAAFPIVFFSISQSKLPGYILPAVPPLLLLLADPLARCLNDKQPRRRWPGLLSAGGLVCSSILLLFLSKLSARYLPNPSDATSILLLLAVATTLAALAVLLLSFLRLNTAALAATILVLLFLVVQIDRVLKHADSYITAREAVVRARELWPDFSADRAATWDLKRSFVYQLNFYTHTDLPEWTPQHAKPQWLFIDPARILQARAQDYTCADFLGHPTAIPCRKRIASAAGLETLGRFARSGVNRNSADR